MKTLLVITLCTVAYLAVVSGYKVEILAPDGERMAESGHIKDVGGKRVLVKEGDFSYHDPKLVPVQERWSADERGFTAEGNRLPTPPPIPLAIQESLVKNNVKPPFGPGSQ
ncbi:unnamed protein product [Allacma fusca]|uniref:Uncharacterized protein n=1 Tax=Allacma fusca TaxID=39272 RepID=A0A8J2KI37_9HEXA|nr:unnamed protein product [Allacma fusca]